MFPLVKNQKSMTLRLDYMENTGHKPLTEDYICQLYIKIKNFSFFKKEAWWKLEIYYLIG